MSRRDPLSRDRVIAAAVARADRDGIGSLSMRKLAEELGVEAMSLYHHVANKDEILDGMVDAVMGEIELPAPGGDWRTAVRRSAISAHEAFRRHPWGCELVMARQVRPGRLRYMDALLGCFRAAGFPPFLTYHAYHSVDGHILGFTLWEQGHTFTPEAEAFMSSDAFQRELQAAYPHLAAHAAQHLDGSTRGGVSAFEFGLDLILDGLEHLRAAG